MATNPHLSLAVREAALNAAIAVNSGNLIIYDGVQPADPDTAVSTQNVLATFTLGATAWAAATGSIHNPATMALNAVTPVTCSRTGTAAWFRMLTSGAVAVLDGSIGTSGCDLNLNAIALVSGAQVAITSGSVALQA